MHIGMQQRDGHASMFKSKWWWWEISSSITSLIGLGLVVFILKQVDNQPISSWPYSIQPNSLIAVITTITKASMLVPIASCLSQLKWDHFQYRPNPLNDFQIYDDASRGPWGCIYMICTGHLKAVSAWALALLTLAALGIEPSIQQTIQPRTKQVLLTNVTAQIGRASNYTSKGLTFSFQEEDLLRLQTTILNGAIGSASEPNVFCPELAVRCSWDQFDTLAVCAHYTNTTDVVEVDCRTTNYDTGGNKSPIRDCIFLFPEARPVRLFQQDGGSGMIQIINTSESCAIPDCLFNPTPSDPSQAPCAIPGCLVGPNILNVVRLPSPSLVGRFEAFTITLNWCARVYHNMTASPAGIQASNYTSNPLSYHNITNQDQDIFSFYSNSSARYFNISRLSLLMPSYVIGLFSVPENVTSEMQQNSSPTWRFSTIIYYADLDNFTASLEETLTNQVIRSSSPGDNRDSTMWPGEAYYQETYWLVHWPWVTLPIFEVVATIILLTISIMFTKDQPLFKSSPLAIIFHPLEGSGGNESEYVVQDNSVGSLENLAKSLTVEFKEDGDGLFKLIPVKDEVYKAQVEEVPRHHAELDLPTITST
ncbi:hypothetical protein F4777DRAFT_498051 [Nemania sp. FL0916]|nr:hypothetical protein F4777DRAFT_498051 [Nemania sp. FL0916]